jgi:hypothetical protein
MRAIKGKEVKLDLTPEPRQESELEQKVKEVEVERRLKVQADALKWLLSKFDDVPDEYKKALGIK